MRVLFESNIPSPYVINYLNELGKYCDVVALFERRNATDRDESWAYFSDLHFKIVFLDGKKTGNETSFSMQQFRYFKNEQFDRIIIADPLTPTGIASMIYLSHRHIPFAIQSEGGFQGTGKGFKEAMKKHLIGKAQFYLSGMKALPEDYFFMYGNKQKKIYGYPFASMYQKEIRTTPLSSVEKQNEKESLGITEEKTILSVGRFIRSKGMDVLLKACHNMENDVGIYLIGGSPPGEYTDIVTELNIPNVHFFPFVPFAKVLRYMACCDVFVLATREDTWGLVINEAMSQGAPVITTNRCIAGRMLVENGKNGYLINVDDEITLRKRIDEILGEEQLRNNMAYSSIETIQEFSFEKMAQCIYKALCSSIEDSNAKG